MDQPCLKKLTLSCETIRERMKVSRVARVGCSYKHTPAVPYPNTLPSGFVYCNAASVIAFLTAGEAMAQMCD